MVTAGRHAPLPLFALLLAIHTMLPLSRLVVCVLAAIVTAAHVATSIAHRLDDDSDFIQVNILKKVKFTLPTVVLL